MWRNENFHGSKLSQSGAQAVCAFVVAPRTDEKSTCTAICGANAHPCPFFFSFVDNGAYERGIWARIEHARVHHRAFGQDLHHFTTHDGVFTRFILLFALGELRWSFSLFNAHDTVSVARQLLGVHRVVLFWKTSVRLLAAHVHES